MTGAEVAPIPRTGEGRIAAIVQMWILTASLESHLGGHDGTALAGAVVSGLVLVACIGLYLFVRSADRETRGAPKGQ